MAYRNPAFVARHFMAEAGVSAITSSATLAGQGVERLIDYRLAANMKFSTTATGLFVEVDFGADQSLDRLIIPAGHNMAGANLRVFANDTSPANGGGSIFVHNEASAGAGLLDFSWATVTKRYWRFISPTSGQWEFGELWFGQRQQTSTGPRIGWELPLFTPAVVRSFATREAVAIAGPSRRRMNLEHAALSGTDLAIYDEVLALGVALPFYAYAPDDTLADPILMRLVEDGGRTQDHPIPKATAGPSYTVRLRALEQKS